MDTNVQQDSPSKNPLALIAVVGLVAVIGYLIFNSSNNENQVRVAEDTSVNTPKGNTEEADEEVVATDNANVKEFTVKGNNFKYDVTEIKVKRGDKVRIKFVNEEGFHDWKVDEFNAATQKLNAGGTETIEFLANTLGTFEYYCSVGKHREMGMKGNLIVE